jgi:hypothetical protein
MPGEARVLSFAWRIYTRTQAQLTIPVASAPNWCDFLSFDRRSLCIHGQSCYGLPPEVSYPVVCLLFSRAW